jgi:hypothetical protein
MNRATAESSFVIIAAPTDVPATMLKVSGVPLKLTEEVEAEWARERVQGGLSSGEGVIWAVRDKIEKREPVKEKGRVKDYQTVEVDPGVSDKRLLCYEPEFAPC